ncbi:MAG: hypothetical protein SFV81_17095 [Pirellulaceae bacterium]|nr:hypothetical protein [Pirellulaceae bacterium]
MEQPTTEQTTPDQPTPDQVPTEQATTDQPKQLLEIKSPEPVQTIASAWPLIAYVLALYFVDFVGSAAMRNARSEFLITVFVGAVYGQIALAMVVGGLMGRNWLEGILWSSLAVTCGVVSGSVGSGMEFEARTPLFVATIPLFCLAGSFPLILFRWTLGWRLQPETAVVAPRSRVTIEDMVLVPASLVALWVMAWAPAGAASQGDFGSMIWVTLLPLMGICLILVVPCTYWAFRIPDSAARWVLCMGYPCLMAIILMIVLSANTGGPPAAAVVWITLGAVITSGVAMLGLQLLYSGGYRLVTYQSAASASTALEPTEPAEKTSEPSPFDLESEASTTSVAVDPQASHRKRYRIAVAGLLIATAIVNTGTWTYSQSRQKQTLAKIVAEGGTVEIVNGQPIKISFGPQTTEAVLGQLPPMANVKSVSIAGTRIQGFFLRNNFPSLESLDIRQTKLSPNDIWMRPSIEVIVSKGQFTDADLQEFKLKGLRVKQVED